MMISSKTKVKAKDKGIFKGVGIYKKGNKVRKKSKYEHMMDTVAERASFYRANPQRFVKEYLGINLKLFQQLLIYAMMHNHYFMYLASRGQGK